MDTKLKGDIAEQAVILKALQQGWGVAIPIGDRLPYDLVFDVGGKLLKIQVKAYYLDEEQSGNCPTIKDVYPKELKSRIESLQKRKTYFENLQ